MLGSIGVISKPLIWKCRFVLSRNTIGLETQSGNVRLARGSRLAAPRHSVKLWARLALSTPLSLVATGRKFLSCAAQSLNACGVRNAYLFVYCSFSFSVFLVSWFFFLPGGVTPVCRAVLRVWAFVAFCFCCCLGRASIGPYISSACRCAPRHVTSLGPKFQEVCVCVCVCLRVAQS